MSSEIRHSSRKIDEALELLNQAAREKTEEFSKILTDRYFNLKETLLGSVRSKGENLDGVLETVQETLHQSEETFLEAARSLNDDIRKNPWAYLGGAAPAGRLLGVILGNSKR